MEGLDLLSKSLIESFGQTPASDVLNEMFAGVATARRTGNLSLVPHVGLSVASAARAIPVRANTFYGVP